MEQWTGVDADRRKIAEVTRIQQKYNGGRGGGRGGRGGGRGGRGVDGGRGSGSNPNHTIPSDVWSTMTNEAKKAHSAKRYKEREQGEAKKAKTTSDHNATTNDTVAPYTPSKTSIVAVIPPKKPKITFATTPQDPISGAGELFGSTGSSRVKAMVTRNRRVIAKKHVMSTGREVLREHSEPKEGVLGCDSHADTCCLGKGWEILSYHGITVDVAVFRTHSNHSRTLISSPDILLTTTHRRERRTSSTLRKRFGWDTIMTNRCFVPTNYAPMDSKSTTFHYAIPAEII
jgi:hypothetical protein